MGDRDGATPGELAAYEIDSRTEMTVNERGNVLSRVRQLLPRSNGDEDRRFEAERESGSCRWDVAQSVASRAWPYPSRRVCGLGDNRPDTHGQAGGDGAR
jgi:hypothetical protein